MSLVSKDTAENKVVQDSREADASKVQRLWEAAKRAGQNGYSRSAVIASAKVWRLLGFTPIRLHGLQPDKVTVTDKEGVTSEIYPCTCWMKQKCRPKSCGKHPTDLNWETLPYDGRSVEDALDSEKPYNVGLRMGTQKDGSYLIAIDDDGDLTKFEEEFGQLPRNTLVLKSGGGGRHFLYTISGGVKFSNRVKCRIPSKIHGAVKYELDVRAEGGQVVVAPSRHKSGNVYTVENAVPTVELPLEFVEIFRSQEPERPVVVSSAAPRERAPNADVEVVVRRAERYLDVFQPSVEGQGGHSQLYSAALALFWGFNPELPTDEAERIFRNYNDRPGGDPEDEGQLKHKMADALKGKSTQKPRGWIISERPTETKKKGKKPAPTPSAEELEAMAGGMLSDEFAYTELTQVHSLGEAVKEDPEEAANDNAPSIVRHTTDLGNAARFADMWGGGVLYVEAKSQWYAWDGKRFASVKDVTITGRAKETVYNILKEAARAGTEKRRRALWTWGMKSQESARVSAMVKLAKDLVSVLEESLDAHPWLLNVQNGLIDLKTGRLLEHDPKYRMTQITRFPYDPSVRSPLLEAHLSRFQPDSEMRNYLQRSAGASLVGVVLDQYFEFHVGTGVNDTEGSNGKSTYSNAVRNTLGDYGVMPPNDLVVHDGGNHKPHPTGLTTLYKKRYVNFTEIEGHHWLDEAMMKRLASQDGVKGRKMCQDFDESDSPATWHCSLYGNSLPKIRALNYAIQRRVRVVRWRVCLRAAQMNLGFEQLLQAEGTGILTWLVEGCLQSQREGGVIKVPSQIMRDSAEYLSSEDTVGSFKEDCILSEKGSEVKASSGYVVYKAWCEQNGKQPLALANLGKELKQRGMGSRKSHGVMHWLDVRMVQPESSDAVDRMTSEELETMAVASTAQEALKVATSGIERSDGAPEEDEDDWEPGEDDPAMDIVFRDV